MANEPMTSDDAANLQTIRDWALVVRQAGFVPTRMPLQYVGGGQLCYRGTGPGTLNPTMKAPFVYVLAPLNVRQADGHVYYKLQEAIDAVAPPGLANPSPLGDLADILKQVAIIGGIGLAAVLLVKSAGRRD